jgi:superfamily II DNA helicase RecQ
MVPRIQQSLGMHNPVTVRRPLDRPELELCFLNVTDLDGSYNDVLKKAAAAVWPVVAHRIGKGHGVVYVHKQKDALLVTEVFAKKFGSNRAFAYFAGAKCNRKANLDAWESTEGAWLIATLAAGLGMNCRTVRSVVHLAFRRYGCMHQSNRSDGSVHAASLAGLTHLTGPTGHMHADVCRDVLDYWQEICRGGRDGERAICVTVWHPLLLAPVGIHLANVAAPSEARGQLRCMLQALVPNIHCGVVCRRRPLLALLGEEAKETCAACDVCTVVAGRSKVVMEPRDLSADACVLLQSALHAQDAGGALKYIGTLRSGEWRKSLSPTVAYGLVTELLCRGADSLSINVLLTCT